jgi:hypothetical protein
MWSRLQVQLTLPWSPNPMRLDATAKTVIFAATVNAVLFAA